MCGLKMLFGRKRLFRTENPLVRYGKDKAYFWNSTSPETCAKRVSCQRGGWIDEGHSDRCDLSYLNRKTLGNEVDFRKIKKARYRFCNRPVYTQRRKRTSSLTDFSVRARFGSRNYMFFERVYLKL